LNLLEDTAVISFVGIKRHGDLSYDQTLRGCCSRCVVQRDLERSACQRRIREWTLFWIIHPGQDPVKLLAKYGSRFALMHVKDMKKGTPTGLLTGTSDVTNDAAIGTGIMDWPATLKAAQAAREQWYFIEDESPSSDTQIPQSLRFLEQVQF
jgi:hypothetical protein